jgi:hypothetical protein
VCCQTGPKTKAPVTIGYSQLHANTYQEYGSMQELLVSFGVSVSLASHKTCLPPRVAFSSIQFIYKARLHQVTLLDFSQRHLINKQPIQSRHSGSFHAQNRSSFPNTTHSPYLTIKMKFTSTLLALFALAASSVYAIPATSKPPTSTSTPSTATPTSTPANYGNYKSWVLLLLSSSGREMMN